MEPPAGLILEHPESQDLVAQPSPRLLVVPAADPQQHEQPRTDASDDFAACGYRRPRDTLDHRSHLPILRSL